MRGATSSDILATIDRYAIIIYAEFAALTERCMAVQLTTPKSLIILGALALAAVKAVGFGAQGVARDIAERAYRRTGEVTSGGTGNREFGTDRPSAHPLRHEEQLPQSRAPREGLQEPLPSFSRAERLVYGAKKNTK